MRSKTQAAALIAFVFMSGCGHNGSIPTPVNHIGSDSASKAAPTLIRTGFTEYPVPPSGIGQPWDLVHGPYGTLWFIGMRAGDPSKAYEFNTSSGAVHTFNAPAPFAQTQGTVIASAYRAVWFLVENPQRHNENYLARVTPEGTFTFFDKGDNDVSLYNMVLGSDGRFWFEADGFLQSMSATGVRGPTVVLTDNFFAHVITPGPGGFLYVTATPIGPHPPVASDSAVYVISTQGSIVHRFFMPNGSDPEGIVTGPDHNLWILERGTNKVARMTTTGAFTHFSIPTASSGAYRIVYGSDSDLWFTEQSVDKIGRITTSGVITEYRVPTRGAAPSGITFCTTECGTRGGAWFAEPQANKIGKFVLP